MSWTATVVSKSYGNGQLVVRVLFTDGKVTEVKGEDGKTVKYIGDPDAQQHEHEFRTSDYPEGWLETQVKVVFESLQRLDGAAKTITVGSDVTPVIE